MDKIKATPKYTPKDKRTRLHTTNNNATIIIKDLRNNPKGKTSQQFRDEYKIADVPKVISVLNAKGYHIHSQISTGKDDHGSTRKGIARYWLISEPDIQGLAV